MERCSLIDVGANLSHKSYAQDLESVLEYAELEANVVAYVITTSQLRDTKKIIELCRRYEKLPTRTVVCSIGIHPHSASSFDCDTSIRFMRTNLTECNHIVAIGETGLDYNRMHSSREQQLRSFQAHVALACKLNKPLFLHERDAHADFVSVLDKHDKLPNTVVHCFTGNAHEAQQYIERGFYIGITGFVAMERRGKDLRAMLKSGVIPLDKIMVESDCPFMCPDESQRMLMKARRNEPVTLSITVRIIAECLAVDYSVVAAKTTLNARVFFGIK